MLDRLARWLSGSAEEPPTSPLRDVIDEHMADASPESRRIVHAVAGLLAAVAFADQVYDPEEGARIRAILGRFEELPPAGVDAIGRLLAADLPAVALGPSARWVRELRDLTSREQRLEVLELLVELAAADGEIAHLETNLLRRVTTALGLTQDEYNAAQAHYRERLSVLNPAESAES